MYAWPFEWRGFLLISGAHEAVHFTRICLSGINQPPQLNLDKFIQLWINYIWEGCSGGSRISQTEGVLQLQRGYQPIIWPIFPERCMQPVLDTQCDIPRVIQNFMQSHLPFTESEHADWIWNCLWIKCKIFEYWASDQSGAMLLLLCLMIFFSDKKWKNNRLTHREGAPPRKTFSDFLNHTIHFQMNLTWTGK